MTFKENLIIELLRSIPILVVGLITLYIAYRQHRIEKTKLDKELYEKRAKIYQTVDVTEFLLVSSRSVTEEMLHKLSFGITDRNFVFSDELNNRIENWIMSIWELRELELSKNHISFEKKIEEVIGETNAMKKNIREETVIRYKK